MLVDAFAAHGARHGARAVERLGPEALRDDGCPDLATGTALAAFALSGRRRE